MGAAAVLIKSNAGLIFIPQTQTPRNATTVFLLLLRRHSTAPTNNQSITPAHPTTHKHHVQPHPRETGSMESSTQGQKGPQESRREVESLEEEIIVSQSVGCEQRGMFKRVMYSYCTVSSSSNVMQLWDFTPNKIHQLHCSMLLRNVGGLLLVLPVEQRCFISNGTR
jgi:hypothetical protein